MPAGDTVTGSPGLHASPADSSGGPRLATAGTLPNGLQTNHEAKRYRRHTHHRRHISSHYENLEISSVSDQWKKKIPCTVFPKCYRTPGNIECSLFLRVAHCRKMNARELCSGLLWRRYRINFHFLFHFYLSGDKQWYSRNRNSVVRVHVRAVRWLELSEESIFTALKHDECSIDIRKILKF